MKIDVLVAEIGSTTTIVNAFNIKGEKPRFLNRGVSNTTVDSDVTIGLNAAIDDLSKNLNTDKVVYDEMFATSSAAGGLKMSVHGLVYEMTVKAAKEAALNAGANLHLVTANKLSDFNLEEIKELQPNIILIAGGTDYGERETALYNTKKILDLDLEVPIIYAGNIENHKYILRYFEERNKSHLLKIVENVYPRVDYMNIYPLRKVIYETFEENIVHAKGMDHIFDIVDSRIVPTPGSVMESTMILNKAFGNIMTIDVGGATTDIHSIALPSEEFAKYQEGEALSKRTVEGDLGVFINFNNVLSLFKENELEDIIGLDELAMIKEVKDYSYIPVTSIQRKLVFELTRKCVNEGLNRHVGDLKRVFTTNGQKVIPYGKDLSQVGIIVLTGGALINLENTEQIVKDYIKKNPTKLVPQVKVNIFKDNDYIMASLGVLSLKYPEEALELLKNSLRIGDDFDVSTSKN